MYNITFLPTNRSISVDGSTSILQAATMVGVRINAVCGGEGSCGKCKVIIKKGTVNSNLLGNGYVLACKSFPLSDLEVYVPEQNELKIVGLKKTIEGNRPIARGLGLAFDIGTTTVVGSLVDLDSKRVIRTYSDYNKQINTGADVLSRILYAKKGLNELNRLILETLNSIISKLLDENEKERVSYVIVAGNTTMIYLLLKKNPEVIRTETFPETKYETTCADNLGLKLNAKAKVFCVPGISGYVGGDIVSDIIASELYKDNKTTLLIDVGTNGEVVLGNKDWVMACSSSAGPAFEGGEVKCGVRAMAGAIERITITDRIMFSTIEDCKAVGICGSGLIDLVAELFKNSIIDRAGNINIGKPFTLTSDRKKIFKITEDVYIEEDEIKNIIRSKAAIFSACSTLLEKANLKFSDLDRIIVAGGFGNYLNLKNAITIGLLPDLPHERFKFIGNGAIAGTIAMLLDENKFRECNRLVERITYIDLNTDENFMKEYVSAMFLPHTNIDLFPSVKDTITGGTD